ncbi:MAG: DsrE family protein [Burkholderiales bacterium]|nr:DsrE family protein [Burkholderiales bacterium]
MKRLRSLLLCSFAMLSASYACAGEAAYVEPQLKHAAYGNLNIVVPVSSGDTRIWQFKMGNIMNALNAAEKFGGKLTIKVVAYSRGVELLKQKDNETAEMLNELRTKGVQFLACNNSLKGMNIDYHALNGVTEADIVPAGFLEIAWLQTQNYQVDPMN